MPMWLAIPVTLHCSLTPSSRKLIDHRFLARLKPGTILLNTARGECVDMDALRAADRLGGVGLDVFPREPWSALAELARRPRVIVTPHAAGYYDQLGRVLSEELVTTVKTWREHGGLAYEVLPERE